MHSNLSDHQVKIDCYIHRVLYRNLKVTTNRNPITDTPRKESKHNTKQSHQTTREQSKKKNRGLQK